MFELWNCKLCLLLTFPLSKLLCEVVVGNGWQNQSSKTTFEVRKYRPFSSNRKIAKLPNFFVMSGFESILEMEKEKSDKFFFRIGQLFYNTLHKREVMNYPQNYCWHQDCSFFSYFSNCFPISFLWHVHSENQTASQFSIVKLFTNMAPTILRMMSIKIKFSESTCQSPIL